MFDLEVDTLVTKKELGKIIDRCIKVHGTTETAIVLDKIKTLGYRYSTKGAITVGITDMVIPEVKQKYIKETEQKIENITKMYKRGLISEEERYNSIIQAWTKPENRRLYCRPLTSSSDFHDVCRAQGRHKPDKQLSGMRGLMADTSGKREIPIRANFVKD